MILFHLQFLLVELMNIANSSSEFEPREGGKGKYSRAMFYSITSTVTKLTQKTQATLTNSEVLCQWNQLDPPDNVEIERVTNC